MREPRPFAPLTMRRSLILLALCALCFGALLLSGCSAGRALYHACEEGLCR